MMRYTGIGTETETRMSMMNIRAMHLCRALCTYVVHYALMSCIMHLCRALCTYPFAIIKWAYKEGIRLIFVFGL